MKLHSVVPGLALTGILALTCLQSAQAQIVTYEFNNTLTADQAGKPALTPTDPLTSNAFESDTVLGQARTVYHTVGNNSPTNQQAGLTLDTTGLLSTPNAYSVVMVTETLQRNSAWRRLIDVQNRQSDAGFYVDPSNRLDIYPVAGSTTDYTTGQYHVVILTDDGANNVTAYLDGSEEIVTNTSVMNIINADNPGQLMNFYLDNVVGGGQGEYSDARTALISLYNGVLSPGDVARITTNPFPTAMAVPEPGALALLAGAGFTGAGFLLRRKRGKP